MNFDENNREAILKALRDGRIIHIEVQLYNDKAARGNSPIGQLCDGFELLINRLLINCLVNRDNLSSNYLALLQIEVDKFTVLADILTEEAGILDEVDIRDLLKKPKKKRTRIPKAFLEAFDKDIDN